MDENRNRKVIKDIIEDKSAQEIANNTIEDFLKLKEAAKIFINDVQTISDMYKTVLEGSLTIKDEIIRFYKAMSEDNKKTRDTLIAMNKFEEALNAFLGRTIYLTYVTADGYLNYYNDAHIEDIYKTKAYKSSGGRGVGITGLLDSNDLIGDIKQKLKDAEVGKRMVYMTAIERYKKNDVEEKMKYNPSKKTFYWYTNLKRHYLNHTDVISQIGDIAEGYADAVINKDRKVSDKNLESSLGILWYNHITRNTTSAIYEGDLIYNEDGNIQFAIKSGQFSTATVGQYYSFARNILNLKFLTKEDLLNDRQVFEKLVKANDVTDEIFNYLNEKARDQIADSLSNENNTQLQLDLS